MRLRYSFVDVLTFGKLLGHADIKNAHVYAKIQLPVLQTAVRKLEIQMPATPKPKMLQKGSGE